jgi:predicted lipid-binding transport protein (Tim44 family)
MLLHTFTGIAEGLTDPERLQAVAALLGVLVFGVIVLVAERRNQTHEVVPPGHSSALASPDSPRQVHRAPATAVPIPSAREAAGVAEPADPYPTPFLGAEAADAPPLGEG